MPLANRFGEVTEYVLKFAAASPDYLQWVPEDMKGIIFSRRRPGNE
jgi:hypothetical protein